MVATSGVDVYCRALSRMCLTKDQQVPLIVLLYCTSYAPLIVGPGEPSCTIQSAEDGKYIVINMVHCIF